MSRAGRPVDAVRLRRIAAGLVALALFAGAILMTWVFLNRGFQGGYPVSAIFSSPGVGQQLPVGGDVKVRGVLVGSINDIHLDAEGNAVVEMRLTTDDPLPADSTVEIRSKTVFGQKWVELIPAPGSGGEMLGEGSVIADNRTLEPLELERALQLGHDLLSELPTRDLASVLRALAEGFSGQERDAATSIDRGLVALRAVNARAAELDLGLRQLNEFSGFLDINADDLLSFMESLDSANRALVGAAPEFRSSMQSVPAFLEDFASFQEVTEEDLGRLVEEGATVSELVAARVDNLVDIVVQLEAFTTVWNSGLRQPCEGLYESDMTCWQVYQLPGLESRGIYGPGEGPHEDEPGDPGRAHTPRSATEAAAEAALAAQAQGASGSDLARLLFAPLMTSGGVTP